MVGLSTDAVDANPDLVREVDHAFDMIDGANALLISKRHGRLNRAHAHHLILLKNYFDSLKI